jgi:hypothetical protein
MMIDLLTILRNVALLFVIASATLLLLAELFSPKFGRISVLIEKNKLKNAGLTTGAVALLFMVVYVLAP